MTQQDDNHDVAAQQPAGPRDEGASRATPTDPQEPTVTPEQDDPDREGEERFDAG